DADHVTANAVIGGIVHTRPRVFLIVASAGLLARLGLAVLIFVAQRGVAIGFDASALERLPAIVPRGSVAHVAISLAAISLAMRRLISALAAASQRASRSMFVGSFKAATPRSRTQYMMASMVDCGVGRRSLNRCQSASIDMLFQSCGMWAGRSYHWSMWG